MVTGSPAAGGALTSTRVVFKRTTLLERIVPSASGVGGSVGGFDGNPGFMPLPVAKKMLPRPSAAKPVDACQMPPPSTPSWVGSPLALFVSRMDRHHPR